MIFFIDGVLIATYRSTTAATFIFYIGKHDLGTSQMSSSNHLSIMYASIITQYQDGLHNIIKNSSLK